MIERWMEQKLIFSLIKITKQTILLTKQSQQISINTVVHMPGDAVANLSDLKTTKLNILIPADDLHDFQYKSNNK